MNSALFNRRMRKTARPVVWKGHGAKSLCPHPIKIICNPIDFPTGIEFNLHFSAHSLIMGTCPVLMRSPMFQNGWIPNSPERFWPGFITNSCATKFCFQSAVILFPFSSSG